MGSGWRVELAEYELDLVRTRVEQIEWMRLAFEALESQLDSRGG